jgi:hypothetical protein
MAAAWQNAQEPSSGSWGDYYEGEEHYGEDREGDEGYEEGEDFDGEYDEEELADGAVSALPSVAAARREPSPDLSAPAACVSPPAAGAPRWDGSARRYGFNSAAPLFVPRFATSPSSPPPTSSRSSPPAFNSAAAPFVPAPHVGHALRGDGGVRDAAAALRLGGLPSAVVTQCAAHGFTASALR